MLLKIQTRDGHQRVLRVDGPHISISQLKTLIESTRQIPIQNQRLSTDSDLLSARTPADLSRFTDMAEPSTLLSALNLSQGSCIFLYDDRERTIRGGPVQSPVGSFGRKMTKSYDIAEQTQITRQESPHCDSVSFDLNSANVFQRYVNETLVKRGGFMYGTVSEEGRVEIDFIYEPPQKGLVEDLILSRNPDEEKLVDAIAAGFGRKRVGFIFSQTIKQCKKGYNFSNKEVLQAAELHAESGLKEWVTVVGKREAYGDLAANVNFEAFQMSDMCVKLFKDGWFVTEFGENDDPKLSKMKEDVVVGGKDVEEVDNDFFLVDVDVKDFGHQGPLSSTFPIENRNNLVTRRTLKSHLDGTRSLPFVKRISDFHLLLFLAKSHDLGSDVAALAECVNTQTEVPEGYQLLIESMANTS